MLAMAWPAFPPEPAATRWAVTRRLGQRLKGKGAGTFPPSDPLREAGVEGVAEAVAEDVDREGEGDAGKRVERTLR